MLQFLKVISVGLIVLIFCFFISARASDEGQKNNSQLSSGSKGSRVVQLKKGAVVVGPNIRVHPSATTNQTETSIITHSTNPDIVLAGWNATDTAGAFTSEGWAYTTDGGQNWVGGDTIPTHTNLSLDMSDPAVGIDLAGNLFFNALYFTFDPAHEQRAFVAKSTNNGSTWSEKILSDPGSVHDKNHLTIDLNPASPFANYLYTAYSDQDFPAIMFSGSDDTGATFSTPVKISGSSTGVFGVNLQVAPDSVLYATWAGTFAGIRKLGFNKSTDGGASWGTATSIVTINGIGGTLNKGGNSIRAFSYPSMAVDRSNGPRRGWIYIVYPEKNPTTPDIKLIRSTDGGGSWSAPQKVNQDTSGKDQWSPWMTVDPVTGALFVVYYDSRNFSANDSAQAYMSFSLDGGETFEDILISEVPFLPTPIIPVPVPGLVIYMGDYIGISALNGVAWPCWYDDRTGIFQTYTSRIEFIEVGVGARISVSPETLDFGKVIIGQSETLSISVKNLGYPDTLQVSNISSDTSVFTPELSSFSLPGASSRTVKVVFSPPPDTGKVLGTLTIANSDTTTPNATVSLRGKRLCSFKPGDANGDGSVTLPDIITVVNVVFKGAPKPVPACRGDATNDNLITLPDIVTLVNYIFKGGPKPAQDLDGVCCL